jgi:hypothetical protein
MQAEGDVNADQLAQDVVNAWGANVKAGNGELLSGEFRALFEKTCAYRDAKRIADNRREHHMLTDREASEETAARSEFLEAYDRFHAARR